MYLIYILDVNELSDVTNLYSIPYILIDNTQFELTLHRIVVFTRKDQITAALLASLKVLIVTRLKYLSFSSSPITITKQVL